MSLLTLQVQELVAVLTTDPHPPDLRLSLEQAIRPDLDMIQMLHYQPDKYSLGMLSAMIRDGPSAFDPRCIKGQTDEDEVFSRRCSVLFSTSMYI